MKTLNIRAIIGIRSVSGFLVATRLIAKLERQPPSPPHPLLALDGSPAQSAGCDWSEAPQVCPTFSPLCMSQDQCRPQTRKQTAPATQFQTNRNPHLRWSVEFLSRDPVKSDFEMPPTARFVASGSFFTSG